MPATQDAIALLKEEHRAVNALFAAYEKTSDRAHKTRRATVDKIIEALVKHAAMEEEVFYPYIRNHVPKLNDDVLEGIEEHHLVKVTLAELLNLPADDERFNPKVTVLIESVRHHVKEEEQEIFPALRSAVSRSELVDIVPTMKKARAAAPTRPHPNAPDAPPYSTLARAASQPMDAAKDGADDALAAIGRGAARAIQKVRR